MSFSRFPFESNSVYALDSVNQYEYSAFNPYGLYHYTIQIISPVLEDIEEDEIEAPKVTFQDFLDWCGTFVDIQNEEHTLYRLTVLLLDIAKDYIDVEFIGEASYKRAVCYYVGHYLEMHLKMLKDEAGSTSFNPENKDKVIKLEPPMGSKEDFRQTVAGHLFWSIYGNIARFAGTDEYSIWGGH